MSEIKGFCSFWNDESLSENPYNRDLQPESWFSWRTGWYNARSVKQTRIVTIE